MSWPDVTLILGLALILAVLVIAFWHLQLRLAAIEDDHRRDDNIRAAVDLARAREPR